MGQGTESCGGYEIEYDEYEEGLCSGYWTQSNGSQIKVSKMTTSHIRNAIKICKRAKLMANFSCDEEKWQDWIDGFENELESRGECKFDIKQPVHYNDPSKIKPTRGSKIELICHCGNIYSPRVADLKRGWARSCSKRCASIKRDFGRRDPITTDGINLAKVLKSL